MMVGNGYASQRRGTSSSASISLARLAGSLAPWRRARSWSSSASAKALSSTSAAVPAAPVGGPAAAVAAAAATQAAGKSAARAAAAMGAAAVLGVSVPLMHTLETSLTDAPPSFAPARPALSCSFPLVPPQHVLLPSLPPCLPPARLLLRLHPRGQERRHVLVGHKWVRPSSCALAAGERGEGAHGGRGRRAAGARQFENAATPLPRDTTLQAVPQGAPGDRRRAADVVGRSEVELERAAP